MITQKDLNRLKIAEKWLAHSNHPRYQIACVLIRGGSVISIGFNTVHPSPRFIRRKSKWEIGRHAEVDCLFGIEDGRGTLYITGKTAAGSAVNSKPCGECEAFLRKMCVERVVYSTQGGPEELKL